MSQETHRHHARDQQAGCIKANLNLRITNFRNVLQFSRKQVGRNDRHLTAIGQRNANADNQIAEDKIDDSPVQRRRQNVNQSSWKSSNSPKIKPTTKLNRYGSTNRLRITIKLKISSP